MADLDKFKAPIVVSVDTDIDKTNPIVDGLKPDSEFYFKVSPPNSPLKIKSSVVMRFPLYNDESLEQINFDGIGASEGHPLTFEELYRFFRPQDFAQLLTTSGIISKSIRYGLIYNYFGFPAANLTPGNLLDNDEINYTNFSQNNTRKRVIAKDIDYVDELYLSENSPFPDKESKDKFLLGNGIFTEYAQGLYQLGKLGEIPSFISGDLPDVNSIDFKDLGDINSQQGVFSYDASDEYYSVLHGSMGGYGEHPNTLSIGTLAFVEPIGIDAQATGFAVDNDIQKTTKSKLVDLQFKPNWNHYTNPLTPTYARAWYPSFKDHVLGSSAESDTYSVVGEGATPAGANLVWNQENSNVLEDQDLNSLALTLGQFPYSAWYYKPTNYLNEDTLNFEQTNIASMYKLVPDNVSKDDLFSYRNDPAKTLNTIYPLIFNYVKNITPLHMLQQDSDFILSYGEQTPEGGFISPLNDSDIISPETLPTGITPKSVLRKFRIGHELQSQNPGANKPAPSFGWDNLGYTHTVGTFDPQKGSAYLDIINKSDQSEKKKRFRNKLSVNFKSEYHRNYTLDPINSEEATGFIAGGLDNTKGIFDSGPAPYLPPPFVNRYEKDASSFTDELDKSYFLSTKLLSYLYLKRPSGFEEGILLDVQNEKAIAAVELDQNSLDQGQITDVGIPTILSPEQDVSEIEDLFAGLELLSFVSADSPTGAGTTLDAEFFIEQKGFGDKDFNEQSGPDSADIRVTSQSNFALPVWKYDAGSSQDIKNITWKKLTDSDAKENDLQQALSDNPTISAIINFGIPEWVTGLRIYPCPDKQTIPTTPMPQSPNQIVTPLLKTYKDDFGQADMEDTVSAALKIVTEPHFDENGNSTNSLRRYVEIRYVTEIDIDERKLILDLVGQGVAALDGTIEEYENAGFNIPELLGKSNGNLTSPELIDAYENGEYDFGSGLGVDFSDFPSLVGSDPDLDCTPHPPTEVAERAEQIFIENSEDPFACTSYVCLSEVGQPTIKFKESPGRDADNVGYLDDQTIVKVLKEWVNGKGVFNKILVVDPQSAHNGKEGFINPIYLKTILPNSFSLGNQSEKIFFEQKFPYKLQETDVTFMSDMARALVPTWYRNIDQPYYHREDGEHWVSVTLPQDCIASESALENMKEIAKVQGLRKILDFYNKSYSDEELQKLAETYLVCRADDYHLDARPGSRVKILVKVGGIYVNSFPSNQDSLDELKKDAARILSLDSRYFELHLQQALFSLNKIYLDIFSSKFKISGLDLSKESERLSFVPVSIKKIIAVNGYDITKQTDNIINIGFDENFNITFMSYIEDANDINTSSESLLDVGFDYFKNLEPFSFPNTMALLYYHRELKNPLLKWETLVNEWMPEPKPQIIPKNVAGPSDLPSNSCGLEYFQLPPFSSIMMGIAERLDEQLDLHPRYDLGAFQFSLLQFFPPCPKPPSGKGTSFFNFLSEIDGQTTVAQNGEFLAALEEEADRVQQYVGDWLSSGAALRDLKGKIFDLDDLYSYVLNYITPEVLYAKICKCFLDVIGVDEIGIPNLTIDATGGSGGLNLDPSTIANNPKNVFDSKGATFNTNFVDEDGNFKKKDAFMEKIPSEDLFCSFCFSIPSVFFRLPTTDILQALISALKALLEFALAQILLELIAALLDALLTCPELNCPTGETRVQDFGSQDIPTLIEEYGGDMLNCGLIIDGVSLTEQVVTDMMSKVSKSLTTSEVLGLFDGSAPKAALEVVESILVGYPSIEAQLGDLGKIEDFFACMGTKVSPELFDFLEEVTNLKIDDPSLCSSLIDDAKQNLFDKCGNIPGFDEIANRNLNHDLDKYKELAKIIRDNDDLSSQLPPLFSDGKGTQALMSSLSTDTANHALDKALETMFIPIESQLINDTNKFTKASENVLVKKNSALETLLSLPPLIAVPMAIFQEDQENNLAGLEVFDSGEIITIDKFMAKLSDGLNFGNAAEIDMIKADLTDSDFVHLRLTQPSINPESGEPEYTDNYSVVISSKDGIEAVIEGEQIGIGDELKAYLNTFPLETGAGTRPEQAQFFSNLLLSNFKDTEVLKDFFAGPLYYSILSSMIDQMGKTCSDSNMLKKYDASRWQDPSVSSALAALFLASPIIAPPLTVLNGGIVLTTAAAVALIPTVLPSLKRVEVEGVNLTSTDASVISSKGPQTFIDFNYSSKLAKQAYDFSKFYDPNSEVIGMPHFSMLEAVVSSMMQLFIGETFAKGLFVAPFFPKEVFLNEIMVQFVFEQFNIWLNSHEDGYKFKWYTIITRMIYEKPEFTASLDSPKPGLPGEFGLQTGVIDGKIYDVNLGRDFEIKNWKDATCYYIRQNIERPIAFIKDKLKETTLKAHIMDKEVNPVSFISYKTMKEVHEKTYSQYEGEAPLASSLFEGSGLEEFKNGKFVFQYYYRFEELSPEDPMYNENVANRDIIKVIGDPFGFNPPPPDGALPINPFVEDPNDPLGDNGPYVPEDPLPDPFGEDNNLKGVLNAAAIDKIWSTMANSTTNIAEGHYNISTEDQKKSFSSFFKSIKLGVRLCYAVVSTNEKDAFGELIINQGDAPQVQEIKDMISNINTTLLANSETAPEVLKFAQREKVLTITEISQGTEAQIINSTYIFPVINKEVDITNDALSPFSLPVDSYYGLQFGESILSQLNEYVKAQAGADKIQKIVNEMFSGVEIQALYSYAIPIPKLATMLMIYNVLGIVTDNNVNKNFDKTKEIIKQSFESIYDIKGNKAYAYQAPFIKDKGGPRGIAVSAQSELNK